MGKQLKLFNYDDFVDKFKPKKTTDDCYTPEYVYEAVCLWVDANLLPLEGLNIVRPFYPGGDYEAYDYQPGDVVIDNPPFSILAKIVDFYTAAGVRFFLFAPHLTSGGYCGRKHVTTVVVEADVVYGNGAVVATDFLTNFYPGDVAMALRGDLTKYMGRVIRKHRVVPPEKRKIIYPDCLISSATAGRLVVRGICLDIPRDASIFVRKLDHLKRGIFGGGLLLSERAAAERAAAERAAAERAVLSEAEQMAASRLKGTAIIPVTVEPPMPGGSVKFHIPKLTIE